MNRAGATNAELSLARVRLFVARRAAGDLGRLGVPRPPQLTRLIDALETAIVDVAHLCPVCRELFSIPTAVDDPRCASAAEDPAGALCPPCELDTRPRSPR